MAVEVDPAEFVNVDFDAGEIAAIVETLAAQIGLDADIRIEVDETAALGRTDLADVDPIRIRAESGAFEDPRKLRQFSPALTTDVLGRHLWRARDRRDPAFGAPPTDRELSLAHRAAWDTYAAGRLARAGHPIAHQRFLYTFRNRHGFSDLADEAFAFLLDADGLTWADIVARSDEASAVNAGSLDRKPA